jgi:hypothetical protein
MSTDTLRDCTLYCDNCKSVFRFKVWSSRVDLLRCTRCGCELKEFKVDMSISEDQARTILLAFDKLQMEDMLLHDQRLCALAIMDFYPSLDQEYFYLRDRYDEKKLREQEFVDPS